MWIIAVALLVVVLFRLRHADAAVLTGIAGIMALLPLSIAWAGGADGYRDAHTEFWDAVDDKIEASQVIDALPSCSPEWVAMMSKRVQIDIRLNEAQEAMHEHNFCGVQWVWCPWCDCEE